MRAVAAVEHIVGSEEPLVATPESSGARPRRRRWLAGPLGISLFVVSGVAVALALSPLLQPEPSGTQTWQSARR